MTTIEIFKNPSGQYTGITTTGHANYAEQGSDIVCAAVSGIVQGIALGIDKYSKITDFEKKSGRLKIVFYPNDNTEVLIQTLILSISDLEANYPKNIKLKGI